MVQGTAVDRMELEPKPWLEIDLDAISRNVRVLKRRAGVPLLAVVKCDGYGHGLVPSAKAALSGGACGVAVRGLDEAERLRRAGVRARIVNLFPHHPVTTTDARRAMRLDVEQTVEDELDAQLYSRAARSGRSDMVLHLKVDTGLRRHGYDVDHARSFLKRAARLPRLRISGVYTTLAERGPAEDRRQLKLLKSLEKEAHAVGAGLHASTTASFSNRAADLDLVRPGLAIYGVGPSGRLAGVAPSLSLRAPVLAWESIRRGTKFGYGNLQRMTRDGLSYLVGIGSADGLPRALGGNGQAIVAGRLLPLLGRVSLNHCFAITHSASAPPAEAPSATIIGSEGRLRIRVEDVARAAGTSPYEILVRLSPRLERRYFKGGRLVQVRRVRDEYRKP